MKRQLTLLYFQTVLAASGSLDAIWAATITRNHLRMAEMDSATEKNLEMTYHMCLCSKNHLEAFCEAAFGLWRPQI